MEGRQLLQYLIDTSDVLLAKKQEATEYLAKLENAAQQNMHLTSGILRSLQKSFTLEDGTTIKILSTPPTGK